MTGPAIYPHHPGARVLGPSADVADAIAQRAPRLRGDGWHIYDASPD